LGLVPGYVPNKSAPMKTMYRLVVLLLLAGPQLSGQSPGAPFDWIAFDQQYLPIKVAADGRYRIAHSDLQQAGVPVDGIPATDYQLFFLGQERPLHASTAGSLAPGDFLEFIGEAQPAALDTALFPGGREQMLHPEYSLYTDTSVYFLTWTDAQSREYGTVDPQALQGAVAQQDLPFTVEQHWQQAFAKKYEKISGANVYETIYEYDGFASRLRRNHSVDLQAPFRADENGAIRLELRLISNFGNAGHDIQILVNGNEVERDVFNFVALRQYDLLLPASITDGETDFRVEVKGLSNNNDRSQLAYLRLSYQRQVEFPGARALELSLPASPAPRRYSFRGLNPSNWIAYLPDENLRLPLSEGDGSYDLLLPATDEARELRLYAASEVATPQLGTLRSLPDPSAWQGDYWIVHAGGDQYRSNDGTDQVQAYADYRSSAEGGAYQVQVLSIRTIYDLFGYGIQRHPLALRHFASWLSSAKAARYLFLIGKGRDYNQIRNATTADLPQYLPSFGYPAGDNMFVTDAPGSMRMQLPVGRLSAKNAEQIAIYLRKVKAHEANDDNPQTIAQRAWMKRFIHLGGGISTDEKEIIRDYLRSMEAEIVDTELGANVVSFFKASNETIESAVSDRIFDAINEGSSLLTFFGHSSPGSFDFDIDNPDNYENFGKYPLMLSLGCYSGNIFTDGEGVSERFTFYEDRAAVAFAASRGLGFVSALGSFGRNFYDQLGNEQYGQGIGEALRSTVNSFAGFNAISVRSLIQQFVLHGDPAIRLHPAPGPDYIFEPSTLQTQPRVVNVRDDSLTVSVELLNLGRYRRSDTLRLRLTQLGTRREELASYEQELAAFAFRQKMDFRIPIPPGGEVGQFFYRLSIAGVEEAPQPAAEMNNEIEGDFFVVDNSALPVYPPEYGITGQAQTLLLASTTDPLAKQNTYRLQLDTVESFDSPGLREMLIQQSGGVIRWPVSLDGPARQVYYWRISRDSSSSEIGFDWKESSFTYIPGAVDGWSQGHRDQWQDNSFEDMEVDSAGDFQYRIASLRELRLRNTANADPDFPGVYFNAGLAWANMFIYDVSSYDAGLQVISTSPTGLYKVNPSGGAFGAVNNKPFTLPHFPFPTQTEEEVEAVVEFLDNEIPDGDFVIFYSGQQAPNADYRPDLWKSAGLVDYLKSQGATRIDELDSRGAVPYIFIYAKNQEVVAEGIANTAQGIAEESLIIEQRARSGRMVSQLIGPANAWQSLNWSADTTANDSVSLRLLGLDTLGQERELLQTTAFSEVDLSFIDATRYPRLRLEFFGEDPSQTPPALQYWSLEYRGTADLALNPAGNFTISSDTLMRGQPLSATIEVNNLSPYPVDSAIVELDLQPFIASDTLLQIAPFGTNTLLIEEPTEALRGSSALELRLPEDRNLFNNTVRRPFYVSTDQTAPRLDVTFDGQRISNGQLIKPDPEIIIRISDENQFLRLQDTSALSVQVIQPDGSLLPLQGADLLSFEPASAEGDNEARMVLRPEFQQDGMYQLRVNARDASGNLAASEPYVVDFEIVRAQTISRVLPYPNPFSTSTRFVFTLTGTEVPTDLRIQIMTVSGTVVREIDAAELGPLQIGLNQSQYAWDGTDEFGDKLANGVYLYRVIARDAAGERYEIRESKADPYFENGLGKLVILR